jgi:RNA polymerase sigma factor (sigma-70 family)
MLDLKEAEDLMKTFIQLREEVKKEKSTKNIQAFQIHERKCIEEFSYIVKMKTAKYKAFANYDDLVQEGYEALIKAMKNYNPARGIFFWWANKYISTKISRSANLHTTIRYPLKVAKATTPHKENSMPLLIEEVYRPDKELEKAELMQILDTASDKLNPTQKEIINLAFGFNEDKSISINKICKKLNISRLHCIKNINSALAILKDNIKL